MQQPVKHPRWISFVSLDWYDGLISFLFRFVAKTSEPLLAVGVIVSAADFLQKGQLMSHNPTLASAWAWTQALAIEASTGPVLVFALQAFRAGDKVKGRLYSMLAGLLFIAGGAMLLLQLVSNAGGLSEAAINPIILYTLFVLRVIVASGMVALSCTKHMRFSGDLGVSSDVSPVSVSSISEETMQVILAKLEKLDELERYVTGEMPRVVVSEQMSVKQIPETVETGNETPETFQEDPSLGALIAALLVQNPDLSSRKIAELLDRPHTTVYRQFAKVKLLKQQSETPETLA